MKSIHRTLQRLALAALAATAFLSQAEAGPVVTVTPATQMIGVTGMATVDIIVSGLNEPTGGFSFTLGYNDTFLLGDSFLADPGGKMLGATDLSFGFGFPSLGNLDLFVLADKDANEAALGVSEGSSFILATVTFKGLAEGLSPLTLSNVVLSNFDGSADLAGVTAVNGEICVSITGAPCAINPVPEPETMVLLATGLAALALRRRRKA
ncbi:MAG: PEP-CTERM sorting domain-containing protein [Caldimonas sp.]